MWELQILVIRMLQESRIAAPLAGFSLFGTPEFYLLIVTAAYWCVNTRLGLRLGLLVGIGGGLTDAAKIAFHMPRPYWISTEIRALNAYPSFGLPSAHASLAVGFYGLIAAFLRRRWAVIPAGALIFLVGISRVVEGVHFPVDTIAGWLLGILVLLAFLAWEAPVRAWMRGRPALERILIAFLASMAIVGLSLLFLACLGDWQLPAAWAETAYAGSGRAIDPLFPRDTLLSAGLFFGFAAGAALSRQGGIGTDRRPGVLLARYLVGIAVLAVLWFGIGLLIPQDPGLPESALLYLRSAAAGIWVSYGAPALFARIRLAGDVPRLSAE